MNTPLFDYVESQARRDVGISQVLGHTPDDYKDSVRAAIANLDRDDLFTAEDIRKLAGEPPVGVHHNCFGALIRSAAQAGLICRTPARAKTTRISGHARELVIWRRL